MKEKMENHVYMLKVNGLSLEFVKSYLGDYDFLKVVAKQCVHALRKWGNGCLTRIAVVVDQSS